MNGGRQPRGEKPRTLAPKVARVDGGDRTNEDPPMYRRLLTSLMLVLAFGSSAELLCAEASRLGEAATLATDSPDSPASDTPCECACLCVCQLGHAVAPGSVTPVASATVAGAGHVHPAVIFDRPSDAPRVPPPLA